MGKVVPVGIGGDELDMHEHDLYEYVYIYIFSSSNRRIRSDNEASRFTLRNTTELAVLFCRKERLLQYFEGSLRCLR